MPLMRDHAYRKSGPKLSASARVTVREKMIGCSLVKANGLIIPVKANELLRARELSGSSAHGFPEGKAAVVRSRAVLAEMHEPPRSHEPRIR